jgi:hypothetical protein
MMTKNMEHHSLARSRWAAFGAAVAVALGAGGAGWIAHAAPAPTPNTFVPIAACRLLDTRAASAVGPRHTPLGAGQTYTAAVRGTNGHCTIPSNATAVVLNVTALNGTAASGLAVWGLGTRPAAGVVVWPAHLASVSNSVTTGLSAAGKISFFNAAGTVNLVGDIRGYYVPVAAGPTVYSKHVGGGVDTANGAKTITSFVVPAGTYVVTGKLYGLADGTAGEHRLLCNVKGGADFIDTTDVTSLADEYRHVTMQGVITVAAPTTISLTCSTDAQVNPQFSLYSISLIALRATAGN